MGIVNNIVLDSEGKKYLNLGDSPKIDESQIGNTLSNFEVLNLLCKDEAFNSVIKVRSLNNKKLYTLKEFKNCSNNTFLKQTFEELKFLDHPNIMKYYGYFQEKSELYLIMEYMHNADIESYVSTHYSINKFIPEVEIWNILLQSLSGLEYISNINRNANIQIKLRVVNIFINNKENTKLGILNDPMYNPNDLNYYDKQNLMFLCDVFYKILNPILTQNQNFINYNSIQSNNCYSYEINNIINNMNNIGNNNNNQNVNITGIYNFIKNEYTKKYNKSTSIKAILESLYSFGLLNKKIINKRNIIESNMNKYYINFIYLKIIDAFYKSDIKSINYFVEEFRRAMALSNFKLVGDKEVDPLLVLTFILDRLHKENNNTINKENINNNEIEENETTELDLAFNGGEEDRTNQSLMLDKFVSYFNINMNSPISDLFIGFVKTKRVCQTCKSSYFFFSNCLYIIFDLSDRNSNLNFDLIKDGFETHHNFKKNIDSEGNNDTLCEICFTYRQFDEYNRYYLLNRYLIICFIRGNNYQNRSGIIFNNNIDLKNFIETSDSSPSNYNLLGSVNRKFYNNTEQFVSRNQMNNIQTLQQNEQILMLFYNSIDSKN